jgi:CheY-like chemotaxis protein
MSQDTLLENSMTKVLVVDDDVEAAETLALLLSLSGHEVHVAHNGRQALDAWNAHRHPVVFLDLEMPVMDGFDVAKTIRDVQEFAPPVGRSADRARTGSCAANQSVRLRFPHAKASRRCLARRSCEAD